MRSSFGPVRQLGYVVRDLDAAMKHWLEVMGVGPFVYLERPRFFDYRYKGEPADIWINAGFAQYGDLQVELIEQKNEAPSIYLDFLASGQEGLQHIAFWQKPGDYEHVLERSLMQGFTVTSSAASVEPEGKLVYFDQKSHLGTVVELSCLSPRKKEIFDRIADLARNWDGTDPIRTLENI